MNQMLSCPSNLPAATVPMPPPKPHGHLSFALHPYPGENLAEFCRRLGHRLHERAATPLHLLIYGDCRASDATALALRQVLGRTEWPVTWVAGAACDGGPIAGMQVEAFTGGVERIEVSGRVAGSIFTDGGARQCLLGGLTPANRKLSPAGQTVQVLEQLQTDLASAGFTLADTVRTWFFLDDILSWYDDFNRARTGIYSGVKFNTGSLPASTGVGAANPAGAALALAAWAYQPFAPDAGAREIASPLQCPAPAYGSSFSRAMELAADSGRRLFISGTASIAPGGKTLWTGDVRKQVQLTMEVVEAILRSRHLTYEAIKSATAYFRHPGDAGVFADWLALNELSHLPVISAQCDVCRDDLLFELEAEAVG